MSSYLLYYLAVFLFSYASENPYVLVVVLVLFALRDVVPDPAALWRALVSLRRRKIEIALNPANLTARRDLAWLYLELRMPQRALAVLSEAAERAPRDREIAYLRGVAFLRSGDPEQALAALARASGLDPETGAFETESRPSPGMSNSRTAEIFLTAASALEQLGRWEGAEEALLAASELNSSSMEARVRLAAIYKRKGEKRLLAGALGEIASTWSTLPGFSRRGQWTWYVRGLALRVF